MTAKTNDGYAIHLARKHLASEMVQELALIGVARYTSLRERPEDADRIHARFDQETERLLALHEQLDRELAADAAGVRTQASPGEFAPRRKRVYRRLHDILDVMPGDPLGDLMQLVTDLSLATLLCGLSPMGEDDIASVRTARNAVLDDLRRRLKAPPPPAPRAAGGQDGLMGMLPPSAR